MVPTNDVSAEFVVRNDELVLSFEARCDAATPLGLS